MCLPVISTTVKKIAHYSGRNSPYIRGFIPTLAGKIPHRKNYCGEIMKKKLGIYFFFPDTNDE